MPSIQHLLTWMSKIRSILLYSLQTRQCRWNWFQVLHVIVFFFFDRLQLHCGLNRQFMLSSCCSLGSEFKMFQFHPLPGFRGLWFLLTQGGAAWVKRSLRLLLWHCGCGFSGASCIILFSTPEGGFRFFKLLMGCFVFSFTGCELLLLASSDHRNI